MRGGLGSPWSAGIEAASSVGVSTVLDGWGGAADPNVLLNAAITITMAGSRSADRPMQVRQPIADCARKQEDAPYNVARAGMTESVDVGDLKSPARKGVRVRVPVPAHRLI